MEPLKELRLSHHHKSLVTRKLKFQNEFASGGCVCSECTCGVYLCVMCVYVPLVYLCWFFKLTFCYFSCIYNSYLMTSSIKSYLLD